MTNNSAKATTMREIERLTSSVPQDAPVEVILSSSQAELFKHYLASLTSRTHNSARVDLVKFTMLQIKILLTAPKIGALAPLYDPERLDRIEFELVTPALSRVILHPYSGK